VFFGRIIWKNVTEQTRCLYYSYTIVILCKDVLDVLDDERKVFVHLDVYNEDDALDELGVIDDNIYLSLSMLGIVAQTLN